MNTETIKKEVRKMEQMSNEIKFICRNKIKSTDELFSYKKNLAEELNNQMKERCKLRRNRENCQDSEERQKICNEILVVSDKINYLKKEVKLCEDVRKRNITMKENIREIEEEKLKGKEKDDYEYSR